MYWLMRSASWPPVSVVSPRNSTGLSLFRFRAPTVRWPECRGWRSRSSLMTSRLERVTERLAPPLRKRRNCVPAGPHSGFFCWNAVSAPLSSAARGFPGLLGDLLREVSPPLDFLLDPLIVLRELLGLRNPTHLE